MFFEIYAYMMTMPTIMPIRAANAGILERHISMASGKSSPNTTYSMAPLAKLRASASATGLRVPR